MKRFIGIALACFFLYAGCGHVGNLENKDYVPPTVKSQPKIFYPAAAQQNSLSGAAKVVVYVDKEGKVRKVDIVKSSGYEILDKAAIEFCKNTVFNPALGNGRPIGARLNWEIKFNISDRNRLAQEFIYEISSLYNELSISLPSERERIQQLILIKDSEFVQNTTDVLNFNTTIGKVILPEITANWEKDWDSFPLSFLLYYDFIQRFPDYRDIGAVKIQMLNALKRDIRYIKNTTVIDNEKQRSKDMLLWKLKQFAKENYPGVTPEELDENVQMSS